MKRIIPLFVFTNKQYEDIKDMLNFNHIPNLKMMWLKRHVVIYKE